MRVVVAIEIVMNIQSQLGDFLKVYALIHRTMVLNCRTMSASQDTMNLG